MLITASTYSPRKLLTVMLGHVSIIQVLSNIASILFLPAYSLGLGASGVVFGLFIIAVGSRLSLRNFSWCLFILSCVFGLCSLFLSLSLSLQRARSLFPPHLPVSPNPPLSRSVSKCSCSVALSPLHTCKHLAHRRSTVEAAIFGQYVWEKLKMEVKAVVVAASMHACIYACMRVCVRLCQYV